MATAVTGDPLALIADVEALLHALPSQHDPDLETAIGQAIGRCQVATEPGRPRLLAIVTDAARPPRISARCTECGWGEGGHLWFVATLARQHAIERAHAVHLVDDPARRCRCGRAIEPALNHDTPLRSTCGACEKETAA